MIRLQPLGTKLLVLPSEKQENEKTEAGIEMVELELSRGTVVEVGDAVMDIFSKGDVVLFPEKRGVTKFYQGKPHLWLDGMPVNNGGDIWAKEVIEIIPQDKGDNL